MTIHNILIKLLLRSKLYWANKLALNSKIVIKSFYKNSESVLLNSLVRTNILLLENINTVLKRIYSFLDNFYSKNRGLPEFFKIDLAYNISEESWDDVEFSILIYYIGKPGCIYFPVCSFLCISLFVPYPFIYNYE